MKSYIAELFGTFCLVFLGCGSIILGGFGELLPSDGALGIGLAFGITVIAMVYAIGPISGAHLNPAVTFGAFLANRLPARDVAPYMVAQTVGAIMGVFLIWIIASGPSTNLATTGWSTYPTATVFLAEVIASCIFVMVFLGVTTEKQAHIMAGMAIGLTLFAIHLTFFPVSGSSINPARSIGPALFSGSIALGQLWLYILAPLTGGAVAGVIYRTGALVKEDCLVE